MKKVNPRRRPASQADVEKAKNEATQFAIDATVAISLFVLADTFGFRAVRLQRYWDKVNSLCEDVVAGTVKIGEIEDAMREEYHIFLGDKNG